MARKSFKDVTFEKIIRNAFEAGFRSLSGDPARPETPSRKREPTPAETHRQTEDLGDLATTLP